MAYLLVYELEISALTNYWLIFWTKLSLNLDGLLDSVGLSTCKYSETVSHN